MLNTKYLLIPILLLTFNLNLHSQEKESNTTINTKKNSIDLALGGNGQFISLTYNRVLKAKSNFFINAAVGIGATFYIEIQGKENDNGGAAYPHQITICYGKKNTFLEVGIGGVFWKEYIDSKSDKLQNNSYFLTPIVGLRHYIFKRIVFKVFATPVITLKKGTYNPHDFQKSSYFGISLGFAF